MINVQWVRQKAASRLFKISSHAEEERRDEGISALDIRHALLRGTILEQYENRQDDRGDSCLILGFSETKDPLHVVLSKTPSGEMRVVTVYIPKSPYWVNPRTRRKP